MSGDSTNFPEITPLAPPPLTRNPSAPFDERLRLSHLMLLMLCTGGYLAIIRAMAERPGAVGTLFIFAQSIAIGASWMGLLILASRLIRGVRWNTQPGEWLLAYLGLKQAYLC